jgi:NAD(P)-dependent dehydrogenase (short-subunit alcohol dehydrogenase family)
MKLEGKVALVTGASSGMGRSISLLFAKEGASVVAVARRKEKLQELEKEAKDLSGQIVALKGDMMNREDIENMVDFTVDTFGKLDILVNNAGIMDEMMPVGEASDELWDKIIAVNLTGPFLASRKAVNQMLNQGSGNIINVASIGGLNGSRSGVSYTSSKFGLVGMTKNIGFMYALKGIRCNAICPGAVDTEIHFGGAGLSNPSEFGKERASSAVNIPRAGTVEEIAKIALFLASDDSSFVNGTTIVADAGWTAY